MTNIYSVENFDFSKLTLAQPYALQNSAYFTKLLCNNNQLYIQSPKCLTKQGIINTGNKMYIDIVLTQENTEFVEWFENLETHLHNLIFEKSSLWFHNDLDITDIETAFTSPVKSFRSGKNYLIRCNLGIKQGLNMESPIRIFNENEIDIKMSDINSETPLICILEISGVRFTSRSFHLDINIKQIMAIQSANTFEKCLINQDMTTQCNKGSDHHENEVLSDEHYSENDDEDEDGDDDIDNKTVKETVNETVNETVDDKAGHTDNSLTIPPNVKNDIPNERSAVIKESLETNKSKDSKQALIEPVKTKEICDKSLGNHKIDSTNNIGNDLEEVTLNMDNIDDTVTLKEPSEVYLQIYLQAREKAKLAKKAAIEAYMEVKKIKNTYLLDEIEESDDELSNFSDS